MNSILGISAFYHDSAACILKDGEIIAAAQEERFTRKKHDPSFPHNAVEFVLSYGNLRLSEVDQIVFFEKPFLKFERLLETYVAFAPKGFASFSKAMPIWLREKLFMKKVKNANQAIEVFQLLGIKDVTKDWQRKKGTEVWELPFKTMYYNGYSQVNRFTIYRSGYVRKMVVYGENNASQSCYQLNRVRKVANFVKDYKWNECEQDMIWTGKYRKVYNNERIMIDNHRDRCLLYTSPSPRDS